MADDLTRLADGSMWPTGQGADTVSDPAAAMTAPGSVPAVPGAADWTDPDPAVVTAARTDARQLDRGEGGGQAERQSWDDLSGRREPWRP